MEIRYPHVGGSSDWGWAVPRSDAVPGMWYFLLVPGQQPGHGSDLVRNEKSQPLPLTSESEAAFYQISSDPRYLKFEKHCYLEQLIYS